MISSDIYIMFGMSFIFFICGVVASLFMGGRTALNYLIVKMSRGKKVLVFAKNSYGWKSYTAKKEQSLIKWKYDKQEISTTIEDDSVSKYMVVDSVFINTTNITSTLKLKQGELMPTDFDMQTFNHILIRALTKPNADGTEDLKKMLMLIILGVVLILLICIATYFKVTGIIGATGGVI